MLLLYALPLSGAPVMYRRLKEVHCYEYVKDDIRCGLGLAVWKHFSKTSEIEVKYFEIEIKFFEVRLKSLTNLFRLKTEK
jgi:hypothetical protein